MDIYSARSASDFKERLNRYPILKERITSLP